MVTEIKAGNGVLAYSISENEGVKSATIEYYRGKDVAVIVPECIEGYPVVNIGKKAFLSAKTVSRIEIPRSVDRIGDWAFASCNRLTELVLPSKSLDIGTGVFKDCNMLEKIVLKQTDKDCAAGVSEMDCAAGVSEKDCGTSNEDIFYLLAAAVSKLDAQYLFDTVNAGSPEWFGHFDSTVMQLLAKDDSDGFSKMLLCGEEDYVGDESNFDTYCLMNQKSKVRVLLLRLMYSEGLTEDIKNRFVSYLKEHMENVTWRVVVEEHGDDRAYFDLLIEYDCINRENIAGLIESMGEHNTGMKGYLMKIKSERMAGSGFLDDLDL